MAQHLTLREVIDANRKALAERRLGAFLFTRPVEEELSQLSEKPANRCLYDYGDGHGCAIGVALNPETIAEIHRRNHNPVNVGGLMRNGLITCEDSEVIAISRIQRAHDNWARDPHGKLRDDICHFDLDGSMTVIAPVGTPLREAFEKLLDFYGSLIGGAHETPSS